MFIFEKILTLKKKKIIIFYIELFLIILFYFRNYIYKPNGCEDWAMGLNNTSIDNEEERYGCAIQIPKTCYYKVGKYFLDKNKFSSLDCLKFGLNAKKIF